MTASSKIKTRINNNHLPLHLHNETKRMGLTVRRIDASAGLPFLLVTRRRAQAYYDIMRNSEPERREKVSTPRLGMTQIIGGDG